MRRTFTFCLVLAASLPWPTGAAADDFRVESKLYFHEKKSSDDKADVESTTLFAAGRAYDFMPEHGETTIFDPVNNEFTVLDPERRTWTRIKTDEITNEIKKLRVAAMQHQDPLVRFLGSPKFEEKVDAETGEIVLSGKAATYTVQTEVPKPAFAAAQYADYADWQAQLNALLNPKPMPPFARLELDRVLKQQGKVPTAVELLLMHKDRRGKLATMKLRSEHVFRWHVSQEDRRNIEEVGTQLQKFERLTFEAYQQKRQAKADKAAGNDQARR